MLKFNLIIITTIILIFSTNVLADPEPLNVTISLIKTNLDRFDRMPISNGEKIRNFIIKAVVTNVSNKTIQIERMSCSRNYSWIVDNPTLWVDSAQSIRTECSKNFNMTIVLKSGEIIEDTIYVEIKDDTYERLSVGPIKFKIGLKQSFKDKGVIFWSNNLTIERSKLIYNYYK